jgi:hypothetical protein
MQTYWLLGESTSKDNPVLNTRNNEQFNENNSTSNLKKSFEHSQQNGKRIYVSSVDNLLKEIDKFM